MSASEPTSAELLVLVNAALYQLLSKTVKSYTIGDRSYTYRDIRELQDLRQNLQQEVRTHTSSIRLGDISA